MTGPDRLRYFQENWPTNKGAWFPGEKVLYREKSLFEDFNDKSWMTLLLYGINGVMPSENHSKMVGTVWSISASFPDPRLWNNRVATLCATTRSTGSLALSASTAVTQAKIYGSQPVFLGSKLLYELKRELDLGGDLESIVFGQLKRNRYLPGFGRPLISRDERIDPLLREATRLGYGNGTYLNLLKLIQELLKVKKYKLNANIAIYCAAIFLDLGYEPHEAYLVSVLAFSGGFFPCYQDALEKPEGSFFPLACDQIAYDGSQKRSLE